MISREMQTAFGVPFEVEHVFSCEIEPYKQAYIERNFAPPKLFRDVIELGKDKAHTAYGAEIEVPGDVDLLVAGTSCVDYSNLNNQKKDIDNKGESGQTFRGMLSWVNRHRPLIVVLENVQSAPWDRVAEYFQEVGYSARPVKLDTKDYYIPHTRSRGYLVAFREPNYVEGSKKKFNEMEALCDQWEEMIRQMERPASSPLEAFLLPLSDRRIQQGRADLAAARGMAKARAPTDWGRCASRHEKCRTEEGLGNKRPLTLWRDGAIAEMPEGYWNDWANTQTERVLDLLDCMLLRAAKDGFDPAYRTLVWNLSQNVDREIGSGRGRPGIVPCMTPSMIPYVTNRGGPLIGIEALALQGIPADELLLTRESEDELCNLAGNAMSTTVVGTCILAAVIVATKHLEPSKDSMPSSAKLEPIRVIDTAISAVGSSEIADMIGQDDLTVRPLDLSLLQDMPVRKLIEQAARSAQYCMCEGQDFNSVHDALLCKICDHTRCAGCSNRPVHEYEAHPLAATRLNPVEFSFALKNVLPMRLYIDGLKASLDVISAKSEDITIWKAAVAQADGAELHFKTLDRGQHWKATYESSTAILRVTIRSDSIVYMLHVKPAKTDTGASARRRLLAAPAARMIVSSNAKSVTDGKWELRLPGIQSFSVGLTGQGELVPSWEARLGLVNEPGNDQSADFQTYKQWNRLQVRVIGAAELDVDLAGVYDLQAGCGTAMESLYLRPAAGEAPRVSFFLDQVRTGFPKDDPFVFASGHERLPYGAQRLAQATLDPSFRPTAMKQAEQVVKATATGKWVAAKISISDNKTATAATFAAPAKHLTPTFDADACLHPSAVLICKVPLPKAGEEELWDSVRGTWGQLELEHKGRQAFQALAWITERLPKKLGNLETWSDVELDHVQSRCDRCAPSRPELAWHLRGNKLVPFEDPVQAGQYERALKTRPAALVAQIRLDDDVGTLQIGVNTATLLHQAIASLPLRENKLKLSWRLHTDYRPETAFFRPGKLLLKSNKADQEAAQPPNFRKYKLRPEQLRSLSWMKAQENPAGYSFVEEEISEAVLPALGWRVEGRASRNITVRGGVLADEVGYGKTAISLALIDVSRETRSLKDVPVRPGRLETKATLIVVPKHLTMQWEGEIDKFLGQGKHDYRVVKLFDITSTNSTTIQDILDADIVIMSVSLFESDNYWSNLAAFAARGALPKDAGASRHFVSRLSEVLTGMHEQVDRLKEGEVGEVADAVKKSLAQVAKEKADAQNAKDSFIGGRRITGAAYLLMQEGEVAAKKPAAKKAKLDKVREEGDPYGLRTKAVRQDWKQMSSVPLHLFNFQRVIIDEFTYVDGRPYEGVTNLASKATWVLSGTPPVRDFPAVRGIANFLGVHLGIPDDTEGGPEVIKARNKGKTAAERFHSYRETRTASWHAARHTVAQRFLDAFVRQNVAEITEIPSEEHVLSIRLPAAEHAIYLELDHHINSLQGMSKKIMKSAKGARADRQIRLLDALGKSADPREALIKRCAHFQMDENQTAKNAGAACQQIVQTRTHQLALCEEDLRYTLYEAIKIYLHIKDVKKGYSDAKLGDKERKESHFVEYVKSTFSAAGNGDLEATTRHRQILEEQGVGYAKGDITIDKAKHQKSICASKPRKGEDVGGEFKAKDSVADIKWLLRERSHVLRRLANELVSRTRSLRYFTAVRDVQRNGPESIASCVKCADKPTGSEMCILSACGHTGCHDCLKPLTNMGYECPHEGCRLNLETHQLIPTSTLGREEKSGKFGAKILQLVQLIQSIPRKEKILLFVQFEDLLLKLREALDEADIGSIVIEGSATKQASELTRFQKLQNNDKNAERVLILNIAAASASGANLTLANHVIFVHPVHYPEASNDRFIATETQAIGRIRRYGQKRKCHVYRLLTANTVDERIMIERTGSVPEANFTIGSGEADDVAMVDNNDNDDDSVDSPPAQASSSRKKTTARASQREPSPIASPVRPKRNATKKVIVIDSDEEAEAEMSE